MIPGLMTNERARWNVRSKIGGNCGSRHLDQGSMTLWKNEVKLGVMQAEGLSGPYCWSASVFYEGESARIDSAALPAP